MTASFDNKKELRFVITIGAGNGNFTSTSGDNLGNQITIEGFRAIVNIDKGGGQMFGHMNASIYGVAQSDMNAVTTLRYKAFSTKPNVITAYAIDGDQETLVFQGNIVNAWGNYDSMPDVFLQIEAQAAYLNRLIPVPPRSFKGGTDVATVMQQLAGAMNYTFENNGVNTQLSNPYLAGTAIDQAKALAEAAGIWWGIDNQVLWISPPNTPRAGQIPLISPQSGLIDYPSFDAQGCIIFRCLFNPAIKFLGQVNLQTSIPQAVGQWTVLNVAYRLESEKPDGAWFSTVRVVENGRVPIYS